MNTQYTILIALAILLLSGFVFYWINNQWHVDDMAEAHEATVGHHNGTDDHTEPYEIYPGNVAKMMQNNEDIILLDVRTPEEYKEVHLENALLLPVQLLSQQSLSEIGLGEDAKDKEIILYCRSGARSKTAYDIMKSLGYTNVKSISGGMIHWEEDNYPFTESGIYESHAVRDSEDMTANDTLSPQIAFDRMLHDFGVVPQYGGTVEAKFIVTNKGKATLEIGGITTSCSCTSATIADTSVEPGERTELTVVFDPDFHEEPVGVFKRTVFIPTNDPQNTEAEIAITVDIAEGE